MKKILVLGAGRSSASLIRYLLDHSTSHNWQVTVGDASLPLAQQKTASHPNSRALSFNIERPDDAALIGEHDITISLLPPPYHPIAALHCLKHRKHLITASYVSDEMKAFDTEAKDKGLIFLNECGLDPGIDHMSAMQVIDRIKSNGGEVISFESFTGGLIAPDTDPDNPWRYKFTWNPRNVVMAGQGTSKFLKDGKYKYIPYQQLFKRTTPVHVHGLGDYEGYANRDSLKYVDTYNLAGIGTMLRGTLRNKGFCSAWNVLVQLGCCDDSYEMENVPTMTQAAFLHSFLDGPDTEPLGEKLLRHRNLNLEGHEIRFLKWAGLFDNELIGLNKGTPAQILEHILNKKWQLRSGDKDQIVMWHRFVYTQNKQSHEIHATLVATGDDSTFTAMAKTVGLPLGIAAKLILNGSFSQRGVVIPTMPALYDPVLSELKTLGIHLDERRIN